MYNRSMDDREYYIGILGKAAELASAPGRAETARRIDRRIMNGAAAGAIRAGVPVRVSEDGMFLTVDLGGLSYTVVASAVEAILREDYDRALSVCRYMAAKAMEEMNDSPEDVPREHETVPERKWRVFSKETASADEGRPRFESRVKRKNEAALLPEDRGEGGVPEDMFRLPKRFRPATETPAPVRKKVTVTQRGFSGRKKSYVFQAEPCETGQESLFSGFRLTVTCAQTGKILCRKECGGELEFTVDRMAFRVVGILKDGTFHLGVMPGAASAADCTMEIDEL